MSSNVSDRVEKTVLALAAANPSLTHQQLAQAVHRSTKTIQRIMKANADVIAESDDIIRQQVRTFDEIYDAEQSAMDYVDLCRNAKNEAVRLGAKMRVDDMRGGITDRERLRAKGNEPGQPQPMFMLPPGAQISFTMTTTSSNKDAHNIEDASVRDVTPTDTPDAKA